jgi:hypothetical protein
MSGGLLLGIIAAQRDLLKRWQEYGAHHGHSSTPGVPCECCRLLVKTSELLDES